MYLLPILLVACKSSSDSGEGTVDLRVDQNGDQDKVDSDSPRTCLGNGDKEHIVFQDDRTGTPGVWYNSTADGKTFLKGDVQLNHGDAAAGTPAIACSGDAVFAVWEDQRDGDYNYRGIYLNYSADGGSTWLQDDVLLDGDAEGDFISINPAIYASGKNVYVAWADNSDGAYDIFVNASTDAGKTWSSTGARVDTDSAGSAYSASPQIAGDADGNVVVVWEDSRSGKNDIYGNWSNDFGASFSSADSRLDGGDDAGSNDSFSPRLAYSNGYAYVAWHDERGGANRDVLLNVSANNGHTWQDVATRVDSDGEGIGDSINPVVSASDTTVHVVWQDDRNGGYDIYYRRSDDAGATWAAEEARVDTDSAGIAQSYDPTLTVSGETVLVGWSDARNDSKGAGVDDLFYNYSENGGTKFQSGDIRINSTAPGLTYATDLSLALVGKSVYSVWADGRHGTTDIFFANRDLGEASIYVEPTEEDK